MINELKCNSTIRDKYNRCVKCGKEIFAGDAKFVIMDEGVVVKEFTRYTSGHVD